MFDFLKPAKYTDDGLGPLTRSGAHWEGQFELPPLGKVPLKLAGTRNAPDADVLDLARQLPERFTSLQAPLQEALFEHYLPYRETGAFPDIKSAAETWRYIAPARVLIERMDGVPTIEIALDVAWDEEHRLGARFRDWRLIELCGSVL